MLTKFTVQQPNAINLRVSLNISFIPLRHLWDEKKDAVFRA
jgi:hypothetical protein